MRSLSTDFLVMPSSGEKLPCKKGKHCCSKVSLSLICFPIIIKCHVTNFFYHCSFYLVNCRYNYDFTASQIMCNCMASLLTHLFS